MHVNYEKLGKRIKAFRNLNDLTQEQLAEKTEFTVSHISNLETGATPSIAALVKIAGVLKVTPNDLLVDSLPSITSTTCMDKAEVLGDCSAEETSILMENMISLKRILRANSKPGRRA